MAGKRRGGLPTAAYRSSFTRGSSTDRYVPGQVSWLPDRRPPPTFPAPCHGPEWRTLLACIASALHGGELPGYSGGTAQVFDLLPF